MFLVISPRVLEVITGIAATKVDGVHSLRNKAMTDSFSKTVLGKGVYLQTEEDGTVNADIYFFTLCKHLTTNIREPENLWKLA